VRYFLFAYFAIDKNGQFTFGNLLVSGEKFTSKIDLENSIKNSNDGMEGIISGWTEFKNEEDYNDFMGDE